MIVRNAYAPGPRPNMVRPPIVAEPRLLDEIERYCSLARIGYSTFGRRTVNDPRLVHDMRKGLTVGEKRAARVRAWMRENPL